MCRDPVIEIVVSSLPVGRSPPPRAQNAVATRPSHQGRGRNRRWRVLASTAALAGPYRLARWPSRPAGVFAQCVVGERIDRPPAHGAVAFVCARPVSRPRRCRRSTYTCTSTTPASTTSGPARPSPRARRSAPRPALPSSSRFALLVWPHWLAWGGRGSAAEGGVPYTYVDVGSLGPLPGMYEPHERCPASARPPRPRQWRSHGPPVGYWSRFAPEEQSTERQGFRYIWSRTHPRSRRDVDSSAMVGSKSSAADRPNRLMIPGIAGAGQRAFSGDSARRATTLNTSRRIVPLLPRMTNQ